MAQEANIMSNNSKHVQKNTTAQSVILNLHSQPVSAQFIECGKDLI